MLRRRSGAGPLPEGCCKGGGSNSHLMCFSSLARQNSATSLFHSFCRTLYYLGREGWDNCRIIHSASPAGDPDSVLGGRGRGIQWVGKNSTPSSPITSIPLSKYQVSSINLAT